LFHLKRRVQNKAHVEASICKAYIVAEILIFFLYYFEPQLRTRINRISRHNDGEEMTSSENLSIISHLGRPVPKNVVKEDICQKLNSYKHIIM
jgi:hypothetical protein